MSLFQKVEEKNGYWQMLKYMEDHEDDIAWGINDFGDLREPFRLFLGREPEKFDETPKFYGPSIVDLINE